MIEYILQRHIVLYSERADIKRHQKSDRVIIFHLLSRAVKVFRGIRTYIHRRVFFFYSSYFITAERMSLLIRAKIMHRIIISSSKLMGVEPKLELSSDVPLARRVLCAPLSWKTWLNERPKFCFDKSLSLSRTRGRMGIRGGEREMSVSVHLFSPMLAHVYIIREQWTA